MTSKILMAVVLVVLLLGGSYMAYVKLIGNPRVVEELRVNPQGERAGIVAMLTFADGRQIPVNYLREGDLVFLGADGRWWREFRDGGADVELTIRGATLAGHAVVELDDPHFVREVFNRLRPKAPAWLPEWLNGKLVVITLETAAGSSP